MKSLAFVLIWTIFFTSLGVYSNHELNNFTKEFETSIINIEKSIKNDDWIDANNKLSSFSKDYNNKKDTWYRILDHSYFNNICLYICVLEDSIYLQDKVNSLEQIEYIKITLADIIESSKFDINHIF